MEIELGESYRKENITPEFLETLLHLSILDEGPRIARDFLAKHGIIPVIVPHLIKHLSEGRCCATPRSIAYIRPL